MVKIDPKIIISLRSSISVTPLYFSTKTDSSASKFQTIKKLSDDLVIEKNEQKRIREVMAQNTPKKTKSSEEQEIQSLKEEIKTKTGNILDQSSSKH